MESISIGRYDADPEAQGLIKPESGKWQLVIDKDGFPHLYVEVKAQDGITGMLCIEDMMHENLTIRDLMEGEFSGPLSPEDEEEAHKEWSARKEATGIPCPR